MYGAYTSVAITEELLVTIRKFKVSDRISYFVADNASNNDATLHEIAREINIKPVQQRVRYNAHIINLVAKAILYGNDSDYVVDINHVTTLIEGRTIRNSLDAVE